MTETIDKTFGNRLLLALKNKNINQKDFADKIGVTQATISRYIAGVSTPTSSTLQKIVKELNVSMDYFFSDNITDIKNSQDEDIRIIQRAREKMTPKDKKRMMDILKLTFSKEFDDEV
ncbi:MAG: helix-turn-helix domain-containing protein [Peptoanaerobacter stomatis]|uniref:helix-turn-helix domain-containing protein n=1 Tax=Peptoanaerobacter stomatis TaxID=796937 RepID=UPI003FA0A1D2